MATWGEFVRAAPELAEWGARRFAVGVAWVATVGRQGAPRVHPVTPLIAGGRLLAFVGVHTAKYGNLLRDPRYALHAVLGEDDEEFLVSGTALPADDWGTRLLAAAEAVKIGMTSKDDVLFEFHVARAHWAVWQGLGTPAIRKDSRRWPEGPA